MWKNFKQLQILVATNLRCDNMKKAEYEAKAKADEKTAKELNTNLSLENSPYIMFE